MTVSGACLPILWPWRPRFSQNWQNWHQFALVSWGQRPATANKSSTWQQRGLILPNIFFLKFTSVRDLASAHADEPQSSRTTGDRSPFFYMRCSSSSSLSICSFFFSCSFSTAVLQVLRLVFRRIVCDTLFILGVFYVQHSESRTAGSLRCHDCINLVLQCFLF